MASNLKTQDSKGTTTTSRTTPPDSAQHDVPHKRAQHNANNVVAGASRVIQDEVKQSVGDLVKSVSNMIADHDEKENNSELSVTQATDLLRRAEHEDQKKPTRH